MIEVENIITKELKLLGDNISRRIDEKGLKDTGQSQEFNINSQDNKVQLIGVDYIYYLDKGRGPGKFPPVNVIREYVQRNNIRIADYNENQTVYLIAKGIADRGSVIFRDKSKGIQLDGLIDECLKRIYNQVGEAAIIDVKKMLKI